MVDTAAAAESDRLGDALVELETDGVAYGDLALTIAIHGPLELTPIAWTGISGASSPATTPR